MLNLAVFTLWGCGSDAPPQGANETETSGFSWSDADGDGARAERDCDDQDATVYPGADELCDGFDNDCNGVVDDDPVDAETLYIDADGDGYGDPKTVVTTCESSNGLVDVAGDCDDTDPRLNPDTVWYSDGDSDGYGSQITGKGCESPGVMSVPDGGDCDDADPEIHPGADELCDGFDNDCDAETDEEAIDALTVYTDTDGDGWGDNDTAVQSCWLSKSTVRFGFDCDDDNDAIHPGAHEVCTDGTDWDCSGSPSNGCDAVVVSQDLSLTTSQSSAQLGHAVTMGDIDGDGTTELLVGAPADGTGVVYELDTPANGALTVQNNAAPRVTSNIAWAGNSLAASDWTGDGVDDLAVGAYGDGYYSGVLGVIEGPITGSVVVEEAEATVWGTTDFEYLGDKVIGGAFTGDSTTDLAIGARGHPGGGAVLLFEGPVTGELTEKDATAVVVGGSWSNFFTQGGIEAWDHDGDGTDELAVAATGWDSRGAVAIYDDPSGEVAMTSADFLVTGAITGDTLGTAMDAGADLDGDGYDDLVVSAMSADYAGVTDGGAIYVVPGPLTGDLDVWELSSAIVSETSSNGFGTLVSAGKDFDGDGNTDILASYGSGSGSDDASYGKSAGELAVFYGPVPALRLAEYPDLTLEWETDKTWVRTDLDYSGDGEVDVLVGYPQNLTSGIVGTSGL